MKRIRIVLVPLLFVLGFGALAPACGGGGCSTPPQDQPEKPTTPTP